MSKTNRFIYFIEILWLLIGLFALSTAIREIVLNGFKKGIVLLIISLFAFAVYALRRHLRKNKK